MVEPDESRATSFITSAPQGWMWPRTCTDSARSLPIDVVDEAATVATSEQALVLFDSFLHLGLGEHHHLRKRFEAMCWWPRTRHLHLPIRMADGRADSPGESRGRWLFRASGLPEVVPLPVELRWRSTWSSGGDHGFIMTDGSDSFGGDVRVERGA